MNRAEVIRLIGVLSTNYRNWPGEDKEEDTAALWESMLGDLSYEVGRAAVKTHIARSVYPPTIADIRDAASTITAPKTMDAIEAWNKITDAIHKYGFYRQAEALESLPQDVADMARRFGWRDLCLSENVDTLRAQFRMAWETQAKRNRETRLMPLEVLSLIEKNQTALTAGDKDAISTGSGESTRRSEPVKRSPAGAAGFKALGEAIADVHPGQR